ncbi:MAG: sulfatase, partial [Planctomycetota bacterium]
LMAIVLEHLVPHTESLMNVIASCACNATLALAYPNHTFAKAGTKSVAHYLRPLGYRVALSGKTHIGPKDVFPFEYSKAGNNPDMEAINQLLAECKTSDTPFCLFACSNEPHTPWNKGDASQYPPASIKLPPYIADTPTVREEFGRYLAEITYYDDQVGQILELLEKHGQTENTLVMVVSEQGNSLPFAKWTCYDHGLQSAMIVRWPGKVAAGSKADAMVEYTDVLPTFLEAAGKPPVKDLDGKSFLGVLLGDKQSHKQFSFGEMTTRGIINGSDYYAIRSVRSLQHRLIWNAHHQTTFTNACTKSAAFQSMIAAAENGDETAKELVFKYQHRPEYELYDCESDPMQMKNLADDPQYADVVTELKVELESWMKSQGDDAKQSELAALTRQGKYRGKSVEEANEAFEKASSNKAKGKKGNAKKANNKKANGKQGNAKNTKNANSGKK